MKKKGLIILSFFKFNKDLDGNILIQKNHNIIPANK